MRKARRTRDRSYLLRICFVPVFFFFVCFVYNIKQPPRLRTAGFTQQTTAIYANKTTPANYRANADKRQTDKASNTDNTPTQASNKTHAHKHNNTTHTGTSKQNRQRHRQPKQIAGIEQTTNESHRNVHYTSAPTSRDQLDNKTSRPW